MSRKRHTFLQNKQKTGAKIPFFLYNVKVLLLNDKNMKTSIFGNIYTIWIERGGAVSNEQGGSVL